jgi:hypothetical protein
MTFDTRLAPQMIDRYVRGGWWGTETIYGLISAPVAEHPDREAIVDARRRITYRELKEGIDRTPICDVPDDQAVLCRLRHQPRRPQLAAISPAIPHRR